MELVSGLLNAKQLLAEVPEIVDLLRSAGVEEAIVVFGWGSKLSADQLWGENRVRVDDLPAFVQSGADAGTFVPGAADLIIRDSAQILEFRLCHESDIHLVTDDEAILDRTTQRWAERGYGGHKSVPDGGWVSLS
jgi:hypothetical protein